MVPNIPLKAYRRHSIYSYEESEDEDSCKNTATAWNGLDILEDPDRGKGYKEWLEESAQLHQDAANLAQELLTSEDEEEDSVEDPEDNDGDDDSAAAGGKEASPDGTAEAAATVAAPAKQTKAGKLVEKIRNSSEMDLKRVLFSLKTFFQVGWEKIWTIKIRQTVCNCSHSCCIENSPIFTKHAHLCCKYVVAHKSFLNCTRQAFLTI